MVAARALIREARLKARLSQVQLAQRARVTQSVVSAYENGRREPSFPMLQRLVEATGHALDTRVVSSDSPKLLDLVRDRAGELRERLHALGATDIRVIGSVARGEESDRSDIDLLVELAPDVGVFALLGMRSQAEAILGRAVDIVPTQGLKPDVRDRVTREAISI